MRTTRSSPRPSTAAARARRQTRSCILLIACLACSHLAGCGTPAGAIFDPAAGASRWPPPPDQPRIRFVGELRSDADLRPARSGLQKVGDTLFGKDGQQTFLSPLAVCTDGGSRVFIVDSNAQTVHVCDLNSRKYSKWEPPPKEPPLSQPVAAAYDPAGRLLVSDAVAGNIAVFDAAGKYQGRLGDGVLKRPCGLLVQSPAPGSPERTRIFVADSAAHQVVVLSADGRELERIGERGSRLGQFNFPTNVAMDTRGRLFVSDSLNFRVQVFSPDLKPLRQIGRKGDMPGYFAQPKGIGIDAEDRLFVVDANFEAVEVYRSGPDRDELLMSFGREGHGPGEFWLPAGLNIDARGRIWVADSYNRRVQVFECIPEGEIPESEIPPQEPPQEGGS